MISPVVLVVLTLAVAGMTRALVVEKPGGPWRNWIKATFGEESNVTYLVHCVFCTGFWVGVALTIPTFAWHDSQMWLAFLTPWAIFAVAPHIADR